MIIAPQNIAVSVNNHRANANEHGDKTVGEIEKTRKNNDLDDSDAKKEEKTSNEKTDNNKAKNELNQQELRKLRALQNRDREVRTHEQAHLAAAGSLAKGGPGFNYQRGSDGQRYAVGGEVQIDTSTVSGDPEATASKAQQVRHAALTPAQPSQQDRSVAVAATAMEARVRVEIAHKRIEDAVEKLNERFSSEESKVETEQVNEFKSAKEFEVDSKCAECGGQHNSDSHPVATTLGEPFAQLGQHKHKGSQFNFAI